MTSSTTTGRRSPLQHWLEFLTSNRLDSRRSTNVVEAPSYVAVVQAQREDVIVGWDPHEVWLDRIKKPRDDQTLTRAARDLSREAGRGAEVKKSR
jgi:hypothetical protein